MIRILEIYNKTEIPHVYREELWLVCFAEAPHRDPLEALFDDEPPADCRGCRQPSGRLKLSSSTQEFLVPPAQGKENDEQKPN
jgi:hypothetical protein